MKFATNTNSQTPNPAALVGPLLYPAEWTPGGGTDR